jgi:group I intron endonuclease
MEDKKFIVYKHENLINHKVYIGQTCQKPKDRWQGGAGYRKNKEFYDDIQIHGWNNFSHEILAENLTQLEAN